MKDEKLVEETVEVDKMPRIPECETCGEVISLRDYEQCEDCQRKEVQKTKQECEKRKIRPFLRLRKEGIQFVERVLKEKWKPWRAMDVVDCFLVQMIDYFKKDHADLVARIEKLKWKVTDGKNIQILNNEAIARNQGLDDVLRILKEKK